MITLPCIHSITDAGKITDKLRIVLSMMVLIPQYVALLFSSMCPSMQAPPFLFSPQMLESSAV